PKGREPNAGHRLPGRGQVHEDLSERTVTTGATCRHPVTLMTAQNYFGSVDEFSPSCSAPGPGVVRSATGFSLTAALALNFLCLAASTLSAADKVDFGRDILPLISTKCFHCHGP